MSPEQAALQQAAQALADADPEPQVHDLVEGDHGLQCSCGRILDSDQTIFDHGWDVGYDHGLECDEPSSHPDLDA